MNTRTITPTLMLGELPDLEDAYLVDSAAQAVQLIQAGLVAVLPAGAWSMAEDALRAVTDDHDAISRALRFARFGDLLIERCACPACLAGVTRRQRSTNGALIEESEPISGRIRE